MTQGFANLDEHANVEMRRPHWGNSYEAAAPAGPHNRFPAYELDNMYSVLTRPSNYSGVHPNNSGNFQVRTSFRRQTLRIAIFFNLLGLSVGQRLCIDFFPANFLTTLRSHLDVTCF